MVSLPRLRGKGGDQGLPFYRQYLLAAVGIPGTLLGHFEPSRLADFHFHDLRHTAASYLAMHGANLMEIAEVLRHKTLNMVKRYAHLSAAHTRSVLERMHRAVFGE